MPVGKKGGFSAAEYWEERAGRLVAEERCRGLEALVSELRARPPHVVQEVPILPNAWPAGGFGITGPAAVASAALEEPGDEVVPSKTVVAESPVIWLSKRIEESVAAHTNDTPAVATS